MAGPEKELVVGETASSSNFSLFPLVLLSCDCDLLRVSARISSRLTLDCENGVSSVSRISTNLELAMAGRDCRGTSKTVVEYLYCSRESSRKWDGNGPIYI